MNIPAHVDDPGVADASDAIGWEDTEDCSNCGPGALQDLMWLAPGLKRPMLVLMVIRSAVSKMLCGTTDAEGCPNILAVAYGHCLEEGMVPAHESAYCSYSAQVQLCEHLRKRDADAGRPSPFLLPSTTQMSDVASAQYLANVYYKALQKAATKTPTLKRQLAIKHEENPRPLPKMMRQGGCVVCNSVAGVNLLKCSYCPQHCPFPSCCVKSHRKQ